MAFRILRSMKSISREKQSPWPWALCAPVGISLPHNAAGGERRGRAIARYPSARPPRLAALTETLRYLYAASPLPRLLQFYSQRHAMARGRPPCANVSLVPERSEAPNWLGLYHIRSGHSSKQLTHLSFNGG